MPDSSLDDSKFYDQCRCGARIPRYAGPSAQRVEDLDRAGSRQLDRADAPALDEPWQVLLTPRCPRCGALAEQWADVHEPSIKPLAEPEDSPRLPKLDILDPDFLATADQQTLLGALLEAALDRSPADAANAQLIDRNRGGLYIAAQQGFERPFLDFFERVTVDGSACAVAATKRTTVMVPNVVRSPLFTDAARQAMLDARSYAVHSIPLLSSTGQLLGVFSCHYHKAGRPSDDVTPLLVALAKAAASSLQWQARQVGDGSHATSEADRPRGEDRNIGHANGQPPDLAAGIRKIATKIHRLIGNPPPK